VADDKVVASGRQSIDPPRSSPVVDTLSIKIDPGRYRLRVAALDADRRGSVMELPLVAGLRALGPFQTSDLIVGAAGTDRIQPAARIPRGAGLVAIAQLYADDARDFDRAELILQLASDGRIQPLSTPMTLIGSADVPIRAAKATLEIGALPPGRYTASAVLHIAGKPVGKVSRAVEIVR